MFPWESRRTRRNGRTRYRPAFGLGAAEALEGRQLLAYSVLGFSLPDLTVQGFASPVASWGGPLTVTVDVRNLGASTIIEPLALDTNAVSSADAPASTVAVYAVRNPHSLRGAVQVGTVVIPALRQNSAVQVTQTITLPQQPLGFPGDGGTVYLVFQANSTGTVFESDLTNNVSGPVALKIEAPLPELAAIALDVPPVMQPGDVIQPNIRVANYGPADTLAQGPVLVALVASPTPNFVPGTSTVLAVYSVSNIPGASQTASMVPIFGDVNQTPQSNVVTIVGNPVQLPTTPGQYFLGVVVDPLKQLKQLSNVATFAQPQEPFTLAHVVGPPIPNLPPAVMIQLGGAANVPLFPNPYRGLPIGGSLDGLTFPAPFPPPAPVLPAATTTTGGGGTIVPVLTSGGLTPRGRILPTFGHGLGNPVSRPGLAATSFGGLNSGRGFAAGTSARVNANVNAAGRLNGNFNIG